MVNITLDLSPILVNRPAVYNICRDVDDILRTGGAARVDYQFLGRRMAQIPPPEAQQQMRTRFIRQIETATFPRPDSRPGGRDSDPSQAGTPELGASRIFYLDPAYTVYGTLGANDIVMCHDLSPLTHPHWHGESVRRLYESAYRMIVRSGCKVVADSDNTADTFRANYARIADVVQTVHLYMPRSLAAAATVAAEIKPPLTDPYFLFVGSLEARKNITGAIRAFALSGLADRGYRLLVIGQRAHGAEAIEHIAAATDGVVLCGFLTEAEKHAAYAGATGFVYPSYLEGFGMPLLEAMAFGIPSVTTTTGASPEIGGPDVPCRDPDDHAAIAAALCDIASLSKTKRARLGARLRKRAYEKFSFERFARQIAAVVLA